MYKISIIVPVYKVEHVMDRCIESILNQTYENIEIILVDDGSPDNCGAICDEYANKHQNISVIHKENGGLSDARNVGLMESTGDYILFVDSDDFIDWDACERFIKCIEKNDLDLDILMGDAKRFINDKKYEMKFDIQYLLTIHNGKDFLKHQLQKKCFSVAAWRNLYRRKFLIENNLFFLKGILHEDEEWLPRVLLEANTVMTTGISFYNYIIRENSITQKKEKRKNAIDLLNTCYYLDIIYKNIVDRELQCLLNEYLLKLYLSAFYMGKLYDEESKKYLRDSFLEGKAKSLKSKLQVVIYNKNKLLYFKIYDLLS